MGSRWGIAWRRATSACLALLAALRAQTPWRFGLAGAAGLVAMAALARLAILGPSSGRDAYVTFWPVVMLAVLVGGAPLGVTVVVLSALVVHSIFVPLHDIADWLALAVFLAGGGFIAGVTELFLRARAQALAAQDIQSANSHLAEIVESSTDPILSKGLDGTVTSWNRAASQLFGYSRDEIMGKSVALLVPPARMGEETEIVARLKRGERVERLETVRVARNGRVVDVSLTISPVRDDAGAVVGASTIVRDITELKAAEAALRLSQQALRESERRLRLLTEASFNVVYRMSADWTEMRRLNGAGFLADVETVEHNWIEKFIPEDERERVTAAIQTSIRTRSPFQLEHRVHQADGSVGWTASRAVPTLDGNGDIVEWFGAATDETARKRAELALRESEQRLRRFYESGLLGVIYWNMDGEITDANDKFLEMVGYTREEMRAGSIDWQNMTPPEFRHLDQASVRELQATGVNAAPFEKEYIRKDGSRISILLAGATVDEARRNGVAFVLDVTERKRAEAALADREAHLRSILDTVPDAMIVIDERGSIMSFSSAASALFGYRPDEAIGRNVEMLMPKENQIRHDGYIANYLRTGEAHIIGYGRLEQAVAKNGSVFPIELRIGEAHSGGRRMFTGFVRDLTSRQKMEEELRQSQKMEAVGQLTGGVAHDINNNLTAIIANLELLAPSLGDPDQRELLGEAQGAAHDAAKLAAQLLAFGRRQPLNPQSTDVGALIAKFAILLRRTLGETIELEILAPSSPLLTIVDSAQLQNALLNLAINARDAMPRGGKLKVEASLSRLDADYAEVYPEVRAGRFVMIAVSDSGTGMPEAVRRRAFEPFFTTKPVGSGTGLGLSMVYGFVKQSGGHIQIYSEPGQGTTVRIYLPVAGDAAGLSSSGAQAPDLRMGSGAVLLVEDDPRLRRVLARRLGSLGYQVFEAEHGAAALERLPDLPEGALLFTDMVMPGGMSGLELAQAALAARPGLRVLFTSGYAEPSLARLGQKKGGWLKKPYTADELAETIRDVMQAQEQCG